MELTRNARILKIYIAQVRLVYGTAPMAHDPATPPGTAHGNSVSERERNGWLWKAATPRLRFSQRIPISIHRLILLLISLRAFQSCLKSVLALDNDEVPSLNNQSNLIIWAKIYHAFPFVRLLLQSLRLFIGAYIHQFTKTHKYGQAHACKSAIFSPSPLLPFSLPLLLHSNVTLPMAVIATPCTLMHPIPCAHLVRHRHKQNCITVHAHKRMCAHLFCTK